MTISEFCTIEEQVKHAENVLIAWTDRVSTNNLEVLLIFISDELKSANRQSQHNQQPEWFMLSNTGKTDRDVCERYMKILDAAEPYER